MNLREWALPFYTILVQLALGTFLTLWLIRAFAAARYGKEQVDHIIDNSVLVIFITIGVGMLGAHKHLSRPLQSIYAILNLRSSWLSREILFNLLFFLSTGLLLALQITGKASWRVRTNLGWLAIIMGGANVYCMAHIYLLPTQAAWNTPITILSFFTTAFLLGIMALASLQIMDLRYSELHQLPTTELKALVIQKSLGWMAASAGVLAIAIIAQQIYLLASLSHNTLDTAQVSVSLLLQLYPALFAMRLGALILGVISLALVVIWQARRHKLVSSLLVPTYITCLLVMVGEILGRFLFYATHVRLGI
jgi:anaerobic dimethyl sulfoxide reductase subunit C (anchor subunit)